MKLIVLFLITAFIPVGTLLAEESSFYSKGLRPFISSFSNKKIRAKGTYNGEDVKVRFNTSGALGLGLAFDWIPSEGSGFTVGFQRFQPFKIREASVSGGGGSISIPAGQESEITIMVIDLNYTHSIEGKNAYGLIGLNYSIMNFSEPLDLSVIGLQRIDSGNQGGGIGFQLGAGYILSKNVVLEVLFKVVELNPETNHITNFFTPSTTMNASGITFTLGCNF